MSPGVIGAGVYAGVTPQYPESVILDNLRALDPGCILLFNEALNLAASIRQAFPDALIFGRLWLGPSDSEANAYYLASPDHARTLAQACRAHPANPYLNGWQSLNEPPTNTAEECQRIVEFDCAFAAVLNWGDRWSLGCGIGGGRPEHMENIALWRPYLEQANAIFNYHGYSQDAEHPDRTWTVYRYQRMRQFVYMPRIFIGETGHELDGWRVLGISEADYVADFGERAVIWRVDRIIGTALFLMRSNNGWPAFDILNTGIPAALGQDNRAHPWTPPIAAYPSQQVQEEPMSNAHTIYDAWWRRFGGGYNPNTAIGRAAQLGRNWGVPLGNEETVTIDGRQYIYQQFAMGIAVVRVPLWETWEFCRTEAELEAYLGNA